MLACGVVENVDQIIFGCAISTCVWRCFMEALGRDRAPSCMADSLGVWLPLRCKDYDLKLFHFSMVAWALWTNRNKMMIEKIFPTSPIDVLYKSDLFFCRSGGYFYVKMIKGSWKSQERG